MIATLIQPGHTWIDVVLSLILMLPGIIAAASSLKNGKHLKQLQDRPGAVSGASGSDPARKRSPKEPGQDWYQPPDLN